ncbi:MAG: XRE family transcriptional regulator [Asticcacaulis sp.]
MIISERLNKLMNERGVSQADLARAVNITQPSVFRLTTGETRMSRRLNEIADYLETSVAYLTGKTDDPKEGAVPRPTARELAEQLDVVQLPLLDMQYSMGGGADLSDYPEVEMIPVARKWVRHFTSSAPENLFLLTGRGDSMLPTINDGDLLLGDRSQNVPRMSDQIWALTYYNMGMIKRIQPAEGGGYLITSDNPAVNPTVAVMDAVHIVGRICGVLKRL